MDALFAKARRCKVLTRMADTSDIERLDAIGRRRKRALKALDDTISELRSLVLALLEDGMQKSEIARRAGISRPTLDAMLRDGYTE